MENDLMRERSEAFFPKCQASNVVPYRQMVSDAIKRNGGGRGIKACTIPANTRVETSKSSRSLHGTYIFKRRPLTFGFVCSSSTFEKLSQHARKFMFCLCY